MSVETNIVVFYI